MLQSGVCSASSLAVLLTIAACSGGTHAHGPAPFKLVILQSPPLGALEQQPADFQIAAEDTAGNPVAFHGTVSISGVGPVSPVAVGMSSAQLNLAVTFELGGDNQVTFAAAGLQPASTSIYVGPVVPTQVTGPASAGSILDAGSG